MNRQARQSRLDLRRKSTSLLIAMTILLSLFQAPADAEFSAQLNDNYLQTQFDYSAFIQPEVMQHYLNYPGSRLRSLNRVRIYMRTFQRAANLQVSTSPTKIYQELWYEEGHSIGLRQKDKLHLPADKSGAIVVGKGNGNSYEQQAVSNALVRLLLDLHLKRLVVNVVLLPLSNFDQIAQGLGNYNFYPTEEAPSEGEHFSVCFRSYPEGKEAYYYLSQ
jgi:hypothetical protein